ncbi:DMT family transporter [Acidaminobacter sp. JC074]|uniref:DMT family transporter n=1 Tax=Acidaminobacter sp. JC074 TaxID=2530199 RepID=UPI001F10AB90|nr:DMT family transporter [Acidaminobacter sp. JC074]MCH4890063.1 DMT family transporter [Acidaminobacter sp. JC074]
MKKISSFKADMILLLVAILWGTTFVTSKFSLNELGPLTIISMRFILAVSFMSIIFRSHIKDIQKSDIIGGMIVGSVLFIAFATQLIALNYTEPGKQAFLAGTYVIFVPFLVWGVTKKRPDTKSFVGAFACMIGIAMLTLKSGLSISFGDSLTLFSSVFFALHILTTGHFVKKSTPVKITIVQFATVAVLSTVSALAFEGVPSQMSPGIMIGILYLGIVCTGLAYFLQTFGQNYTKSTHTAIILSLEAVFGSLLSVIFMKEVFTPVMILGCVIIFASVLIIELKGSGETEEVLEQVN